MVVQEKHSNDVIGVFFCMSKAVKMGFYAFRTIIHFKGFVVHF